MAYRTRNRISDQQQHNANPQTATAQFADNRASAATQLKQQTIMATSPTATAQRVALNTMSASAVQQQKIIQRAAPEEELQMKSIHSTTQLAGMDEEELLQGKFETAQRAEDEELLQGKFETAQRVEDEELLQGKFETAQHGEDEELLQGKFEPAQRAGKPNNTGLPDNLKSGIENLSGMNMDHVKVHYNSEKPAQLQAHAYAQGSNIHVAPGQEKHLPHEAWHVVQQVQGRVKPTVQMKQGIPVNDDVGLEHEADEMGAKALQMKQGVPTSLDVFASVGGEVVQKASDEEVQAMIAEYVQLKDGIKSALITGNAVELEGLIGDLFVHVMDVLQDQDYELKAHAYSGIYEYVDKLFEVMFSDHRAICERYFYDIQELLKHGISTVDYSIVDAGAEAEEEITCTTGPFGTASGIAGEHVTFSDGMKWGIKRAPGVAFVYFEIREGADPGGTRFNFPDNKSGYSPGQMRQFLASKGLGKHWDAFWKITKLKGS